MQRTLTFHHFYFRIHYLNLQVMIRGHLTSDRQTKAADITTLRAVIMAVTVTTAMISATMAAEVTTVVAVVVGVSASILCCPEGEPLARLR
jgi:fatty acid desaturase